MRLRQVASYNICMFLTSFKIFATVKHAVAQKGGNMDKVKPGDTFGKLTVIKFHDRINYRSYWKCLCNCYGDSMNVIVREADLLSGHTKSCGCLRRKNALKQRSKI